jgi:hypothetical protein
MLLKDTSQLWKVSFGVVLKLESRCERGCLEEASVGRLSRAFTCLIIQATGHRPPHCQITMLLNSDYVQHSLSSP